MGLEVRCVSLIGYRGLLSQILVSLQLQEALAMFQILPESLSQNLFPKSLSHQNLGCGQGDCELPHLAD